jgi:ribosomal protein S18 acetylase RimI-like enzyme
MRSGDGHLYQRGFETLLASWEAYAAGAPRASVTRLPGVSLAVFPEGPERDVYNNAVLEMGLDAVARADAIGSMEAAYADAGVGRFAAWIREQDQAMRRELEARGYLFDTATRAMGMTLDDLGPEGPALDLAGARWDDYLRLFDLPPALLERADHAAFNLRVARLDGRCAAAALAFDHAGDCGIFNVGTLPYARRRGLGTALTALQLRDAAARGCSTASLQSTAMAERVYAAVGFRDLGRFLEYVPAAA